jgi:integration host factor subunit alpha
MAGKTLTRADLSEAVHREVGLSRTESADLVKAIIDTVAEAVVTGDRVKLSSFGTFMVRDKGGRVGRNPKTGPGGADHAAPGAGLPPEPGHEIPDQQWRRRRGSGIIRRRPGITGRRHSELVS